MNTQKVYVGQTALTIRLNTHISLDTAASAKIRYLKPQDTSQIHSWNANIKDSSAGVIEYEIQSSSDLDKEGTWVCWAYITFNDGSIAQGQPAEFYVYKEGA